MIPMKAKRFSISQQTLNKLYWEDRLTIKEIGSILGCAPRTISIRMVECGIPPRTPGPPRVHISKKDLYELYLHKGLSSRKIAKIYECAYSSVDRKIKQYGLPKKTLSLAHITTFRAPFSGNQQEKAYLIGFRIGDLRVRKMYKNSETILVDCGSTKKSQIELIKSLFSQYGRVWISKPTKSGKLQIECAVDLSFSFLLENFDRFPAWSLEKKPLFLPLLAGFIDAEGSFFVTSNGKAATFSVGNYNVTLLEQIRSALEKLGVRSRLFIGVKKGYRGKDGYAHNNDYRILSVDRKADLYNFTRIVRPYLKHGKRVKDTLKVINNIDERNRRYGYIGM